MDKSRVVLNDPSVGDYIHASYVDGHTTPRQYICAQGPMNSTVVDFWRMVWQEKSVMIVMLCKFMENNQQKCMEYWPQSEKGRKSFEDFVMVNQGVHTEYLAGGHSATVSRLSVKRGQQPARTITHYHFKDWPDQGVPKDARAVLKLARVIGECKAPVIVHCSGGIGRTGVLVVLDMMRTALTEGKSPDLKHTVIQVRDQRLHSIQNDAQYLLLHRALIWFIELKWEFSNSPCPLMRGFDADYEAYMTVFSEK